MKRRKLIYYFTAMLLIVGGSIFAFGNNQKTINGEPERLPSKIIFGSILAVIGIFLLMKEMASSYNVA